MLLSDRTKLNLNMHFSTRKHNCFIESFMSTDQRLNLRSICIPYKEYLNKTANETCEYLDLR